MGKGSILRADRLDEELRSGDPRRVLEALRWLREPEAGPFYPRARVLSLLTSEAVDPVREAALAVILRHGQHPLDEPGITDLLTSCGLPLYRSALATVVSCAFPSAAEDTLRWCLERRPRESFRLAVLSVAASLGPEAARRLVIGQKLLSCDEARVVSAALTLLHRTKAGGAEKLFAKALRHRCPRNRSLALEWHAGRWNPEERRRQLQSHLADPHHRPRSTAAVLLFGDDPELAMDELTRMSNSREALSRAAAAWALAAIGPRHARSRFLLAKLTGDSDTLVASRARTSLEDLDRARQV